VVNPEPGFARGGKENQVNFKFAGRANYFDRGDYYFVLSEYVRHFE